MDVEKLGGKEELWLLVLVGKGSLYLIFLRCLASREKLGVARLCSVMVEMNSYLGSYRQGRNILMLVMYTTPRICTLHYYLLTL
jgi:hypothetical protein